MLPANAPELMDKPAVVDSYQHDNLHQSALSGFSESRSFHLASKAPIDEHSKNQETAETATCGSEHSSVDAYMEQFIDLRIMSH